MTRAVYTKCRTHSEVARVLFDNCKIKISNLTMYDNSRNSGRDIRGKNNYGKVLMSVREKLI